MIWMGHNANEQKLTQLMLLKKITSKSKLTEKDALELGKNIRMAVHERHKKIWKLMIDDIQRPPQ